MSVSADNDLPDVNGKPSRLRRSNGPAGVGGVILSQLSPIGSLRAPVMGKSLDGTIRSWSAGAEKLYGYTADEVVGQPIAMLVPPDRQGELTSIMERLGRGEEIEPLETVRRHRDGREIRIVLSVTPIRDESGEVVGAVAITHDITERVRRDTLRQLLDDAGRLLVVGLDSREMLDRVSLLTLSGLADWCVIEVTDAAGGTTETAVAHRDPEKVELVRQMQQLYEPTAARPNIQLRVLSTGTAELIPEVTEALLRNIAHDADHLEMLRELEPKSLIVAPLRIRERTLGTILLASTESRRRFTPEDLGLAEDLARRVALALENATLYRTEQAARLEAERASERTSRLQAVTAALSKAATPREVAEALVGHGAAAVGADGGFVWLLTADGTRLRLVATKGASKRFASAYRELPPTSPLPGADVFRTVAAQYFESSAAVRRAAPEFARGHASIGHEAIAFLPLELRDRPIGLLAVSFAAPRTFAPEERELLQALAGQGSQALERARLFEAEREARTAAERAIEQTARLQSLAAELAEAYTPAEVAVVVVKNGVASLNADAGALQLLSDDRTALEVVEGLGPDPTLIEGGWRRFSVDLNAGSTDALRTLEPVFIQSESDIRRRSLQSERNTRPRGDDVALRARAGAHLPLVVGGRPLGVLYLGFTSPRRFSESERAFVVALGRQCAQALERAQLYDTELRERGKLSRLLERLHEGVISIDRDGRVEFASPAAVRMLADAPLRHGALVPRTWLHFPLRSFAASLFESAELVVEAQASSDDGEHVFDITGIPSGGSDAVLVILHDASERERRRRAEREFVDNAAHELRTPLAAITSSIERLQGGAREIPEKRDRFLGHIQRESARLNRLASSLLLLARVQVGDQEPRQERVVLRDLVAELVAGLEPDPGVEVVVDCPPPLAVTTNRDLLEHVLGNLVDNALRHTPQGRVRISVATTAPGSVAIEVADTGTGIPAEDLARLFDRFYRGSAAHDHGGFGLGLPIAKDAARAIGAELEIDSVVEVGTTARVVLPCVETVVPA